MIKHYVQSGPNAGVIQVAKTLRGHIEEPNGKNTDVSFKCLSVPKTIVPSCVCDLQGLLDYFCLCMFFSASLVDK